MMKKTFFIAMVAMCMATIGCKKEEPAKSSTNSETVKDTTAIGGGGGGGITITINPWTDSIEEGEFDLTIPTITGDSTGSGFEG